MKKTLPLIALAGMLSIASVSAFATPSEGSKISFANESIMSETGLKFMQGVKTVAPDIYQKIIEMNKDNKVKFNKDFTIGEVEALFKSGTFK
ncbi:MAG: hypothetical protein JHC39_06210 [Lentimicrobium sp.]|nr:hypothetical protein [Lentimicrobium sp.]